jgi:glucokinase
LTSFQERVALVAANSNACWVGFDLGGTKMQAVVYDYAFKPLARKRRKTKGHKGAEMGLERMVGMIHAALDEAGVVAEQLFGIGVGCPGPLDLDRGVVLEMPNLGWKDTPVKDVLEAAFPCPAVIANDVDAGVYGEYRAGAAKNARCVVGVFPGTGIGGGCVYEGQILRGERGSCLEIGHIPVLRDGPRCGCGQAGCLEAIAGRLAISAAAAVAAYRGAAPHLLEMSGAHLAEIRSSTLVAAIEAGDWAVEQIVRDAAQQIGWAMAGVINLLSPNVLLLGGGLVEAMPRLFREEVRKAAKARVMPSFRGSFEVVVAKLGDDATALGAAAWAERTIRCRAAA